MLMMLPSVARAEARRVRHVQEHHQRNGPGSQAGLRREALNSQYSMIVHDLNMRISHSVSKAQYIGVIPEIMFWKILMFMRPFAVPLSCSTWTSTVPKRMAQYPKRRSEYRQYKVHSFCCFGGPGRAPNSPNFFCF